MTAMVRDSSVAERGAHIPDVVGSIPTPATTYRYLGDRMTDVGLRGAACDAVRRRDGRCVRGKNGSMLVRFDDGRVAVVLGRLLRKVTA